MVKICNAKYPEDNEKKYEFYMNKYSFPLSDFQKWSIEATIEGHHSLICAHTGSGKTLPAEFAIEYFVSKNKKVIYTSPIKALSNQKFFEFTQKYPYINFGLITGDIKINPEADVLIITTEILLNKLYENKFKDYQVVDKTVATTTSTQKLNSFDIDVKNDLACIIFDEVHYINDKERGKIWEESIMISPKDVVLIMLSATIDSPEKFASWVETTYNNDKTVYLTYTNHRIVPLTHYSFITCNNRLFKILKDKVLEDEIKKVINKPIEIKNPNDKFLQENFQIVKKNLQIFQNKNINVKRSFVINQVLNYMVQNNLLPAICFIFSRKNVEITAFEITTNLLEFDSKVPYTVRRECEQIMRKFPNYREYIELPEYDKIISLLEKGIGIHHAGIAPVLREMVELCFSKGYIKLLLATETFAVGINMPTKSVIFTDVSKYDGNGVRMLLPHEYTQMAGRAGRRGIDKVGNVFQLTNLYRNLETLDYTNMMTGSPQKITSKFKISYNLLLNLILSEQYDFINFVKGGIINQDISSVIKNIDDDIKNLETDIEKIEKIITNFTNITLEKLQLYIQLKKDKIHSINKKKHEIEKKIQNIENDHKILDYQLDMVEKYNNKSNELRNYKSNYDKVNGQLLNNINNVLDILNEKEYIKIFETVGDISKTYKLTKIGFIACNLKEIPSLILTPYIENNTLNEFSSKELVGLLSCFTNIIISDELRNIIPYSKNNKVETVLRLIHNDINNIIELESIKQIDTGVDYKIQYDMIDYFIKWCECSTNAECKSFLKFMERESGVFLGDFVKGILKINNIINELEKIYEYFGNIEGLKIIKEIPELTLKYVVTNQSLYI